MEVAAKKLDVPEAVQDQADAADAAQKKLAEGTLVEVKPDLEPVEPVTPAVEETPQELEPAKEVDWEHKYNVLDGMFKTELQKRDDQIDQLVATIQNLNDLLMKKGPEAPVVEEGEVAQGHLDLDQFEGYGAEMTDMVKMVNSLVDQNKELKAENDALSGQVTQVGATVQEDANTRFVAALTDQVADWRAVNKDAGWLTWLDEADPLSGVRRQDLLENAYGALNVPRIALMFNNFKQESGWKESAPTKDRPLIEDQVVPDTSVATVVPEEKPGAVVTPAQFQQASVDYTQGKITKEQYEKISNNFQSSLAKGK